MADLLGDAVAAGALMVFFALAGLGKLAAGMSAVRTSLRRFLPVPDALAPALVASELLLAIALAAPVVRGVAAGLAVAVCGAFAWVVSTALARGEAFDCGCLGVLVRVKVSPFLLAIDLAMLGAAIFLTGRSLTLIDGGVDELALLLGAVVIAGLAAQSIRANFFPDIALGLPVGTAVPSLAASTRDGRSIDLAELSRTGTVLLFLSSHCPACIALVRHIGRHGYSASHCLVLPEADEHANRTPFTLLDQAMIVAQGNQAIARGLRIRARPAAVALRGGSVLGVAFPVGPAELERALTFAGEADRGENISGIVA